MMTKDFVRQILAEEKDLIKMAGLRQINIPKFDELSVKNISPRYMEDVEVMRFLPSHLPKGKYPDREYYFNVLNTVHPNHVKKMVDYANEQRYKSGTYQGQMDEIKVSDKWWDELNSMPFFSCKSNTPNLTFCCCRAQGQDAPPPQTECQAYSRL